MQNYQSKALADFTEPGRNSFNLVRLMAAALVIVSHSFLIPYGLGSKEPLQSLTSLTLGQHAVHVFFVISGLTLSRSITLKPSMALYARARLLRIVPALIGFGLFFAFVMGPLATSVTLGLYFSDPNTWLYPLSVPINFQQAATPPLVFQKAPIPGAINNPLWTIKYEIFAYLSLGIFAAVGALRKTRYSIAALIVTALFSIVLQPYQDENGLGALFQTAKFSFCFLLGVVLYLLRKSVPLNPIWLLFTLFLVVLVSQSPAALLAFIVLDAHIAIVVGSSNFGWLTLWTQQNDISYGTYIYGWPIQQFAITVFPALGAFGLGTMSMFAALGLGYLSWKAIEQPALRLKRAEITAGGKRKSL